MNDFKKSLPSISKGRLKHSLFVVMQYVLTLTIFGIILIQPYFLFGQSVQSNTHSNELQKQCTPVSVQNMTASGSRTQYPASNVLDNNMNTRWSNNDLGSWIQLDLGTSKKICSVDVAWHEGNERQNNFTISASNDSIKFSDLLTSNSSGVSGFEKYNISASNDSIKFSDLLTSNSSGVSGFEKYNISDMSARYLRLTVNGNTQNNYSSIDEISVNEVSHLPKYSIAAAGDWGSARNDNWKKTVQLMIDNKVDLALGLGDYSYGTVEQFQPVVDELKKAGISMKGARGDHDSKTYAKLFEQPSMTHAFDAGPARIILLNIEKSASSNAAYLERELNATKQPWKIVVTTTPLYTSPSVHDADRDLSLALQSLLEKYRVDLVMWGDNHNYERIKFPDIRTVFIQSGTGGESHYKFDGQIEESMYQNDRRFGITKLTMDNSTLSGKFISYNGRVLDSFNIYK